MRRDSNHTQTEVADYISKKSGRPFSKQNISSWENGKALPSIEHFLLLCELYGVRDIQDMFRGAKVEYRGMNKLNQLGVSRAEEYIAMLAENSLFAEEAADDEQPRRYLKLYDIPASAGTGTFLDGYDYEEIEVDRTVPEEADFAVRVSGDSMTPRFIDEQIVFIKEQQTLVVGDIGIFFLNGDA